MTMGEMVRRMTSLGLSMSLMGGMGLHKSLMGLRTMVHHKSLMGQRRRQLGLRMMMMGQRTMELHMMMMGQSRKLMVRHKKMMERIHVRMKLRVSSIERLGVPERHVRVRFQQRVPSCIQVVRIEMRFGVGHIEMKFHVHRLSDRRRILHVHHHLPSSLVATRFP